MIRKTLIIGLSMATLVTLVLFVLSFTARSELDIFEQKDQPLRGLWIEDIALAQRLRVYLVSIRRICRGGWVDDSSLEI